VIRIRRDLGAAVAFAGLFCAFGFARQAARPPAPAGIVERGALRLHFLQHAIGDEQYEVTREDGRLTLVSHFAYTDRGASVPLDATLRLASDLTPVAFTIKGKTYRYFSADTDVTVTGATAEIRDGRALTRQPVPQRFFTIDGYAPLAVQMMLIRYANAHPGAGAIPTFPAGSVTVERRGQDTIEAGASRVVLDRYALDGVVWGRESLWLDRAGAIAAAVTTTGGLPFEAVRPDLESALPAFVARAIADRMDEAARLQTAIRPVRSGRYALVGATIVDGTGGAPVRRGAILIDDGVIRAVGSQDAVSLPSGTPVVDVAGTTIVPGLWDMHAHAAQVEWGPAYLASGVTTIRDMGGEFDYLVAARDAVRQGRALGPRMLLAGLIDGPGPNAFGVITAATPDEGRARVRRYKAAGFVQVKLYSLLRPDTVSAICAEAHGLGMTVTGHIPAAMTLRTAIEAGMDHVAHMPVRGEPGTPELGDTIAFLKDRHVVVDPTVSWNELLGHPVAVPIRTFQPGADRLPASLARLINSTGADGDASNIERRQAQQLALLKALHDGGVPIVAGTDKGVPGFSVQREIELYVKAGFTPLEALQAATIVSARAMGLAGEVGTIEPGRRADLVVLRGNPLEAIANIRTATHVITAGRMYETAPLWRAVGFQPQ
jgi:imidazolonepropionase-like amidohydrolase